MLSRIRPAGGSLESEILDRGGTWQRLVKVFYVPMRTWRCDHGAHRGALSAQTPTADVRDSRVEHNGIAEFVMDEAPLKCLTMPATRT